MTKPRSKQAETGTAHSWPRVRLGELCNLVNGDAYRDTDWSTSGVPIIRIQNLNNHQKPFNYWAGKLDDRVVVNDGDVLLAWSGTPGTSFGTHRWNRGRAVLNQHIFRVDLDQSRLDPDWAVYSINEQLDEMIGRAHGAVGLRHVTKKEVQSLLVFVPPLAEQRRIAGRLREQLAAVAQARAAVQAQLDAAEALPAAHLRALFDGNAAQQWPHRRLGEVCELLPSKSISSAGDAEVRAVTSACLSEEGFLSAGVKTARMMARDVPDCILRPGEVLVARSNTPELVGRVSIFQGEPAGVVAADLTIRLWAKDGLMPEFLSGYLSFLYLSGYWRERAGGASGTMKKITRGQLAEETIPTPTIDDQKALAKQIESEIVAARNLRQILTDKLTALDHLPAALLREAFKGGS